jgi:hypothetical protein
LHRSRPGFVLKLSRRRSGPVHRAGPNVDP